MFELTQFPLKFSRDSLMPFISEETLNCHYGKHLDTYIKNLNGLIRGTEFENMPLADIVKNSDGKIFNNAAQTWNHNFFFSCLKKDGGAPVPLEIISAFGEKENFFKEFKAAALGVFGSGWAWLVQDGKDIKIITTANADTPIAHGMLPLLTLDVWEHAYYLDYQNRRGDFIDAFLNHLVDWEFVANNLNN
ncbi:MAG: superoxide dismutase [Rickettsiales bacterium]|jgi:Fe-Mn family superoxide dismutase|nr:superoxide dismutase [Rickettsiales bacterium]